MSAPSAFQYKDKYLYCEEIRLSKLREDLENSNTNVNDCITPFFAYSAKQIKQNICSYLSALETAGLKERSLLGYAIKANGNPHLVKLVRLQGCNVGVAVSGNEVRLALDAGFSGQNIIYNGNGKQRWEIKLAVQNGCMINIDSEFDAKHICEVAQNVKAEEVRVLVRINPHLDPHVHPYNSTALAGSKFGTDVQQLPKILEVIKSCNAVKLIGLHCHTGSTINDVTVYRDVARVLSEVTTELRRSGIQTIEFLNLGGGLGIDYDRKSICPKPDDLVNVIKDIIVEQGFKLILEPGRSLLGNAGVLLGDVLGIKANSKKKFLVTDISMTNIIRPCLYDAYHEIALAVKRDVEKVVNFDVVGPVCESGDFLGYDRSLPIPSEGDTLVIMDAGAYCSSMSSNYNQRGLAMEVLVDGSNYSVIRKSQQYCDMVALFLSKLKSKTLHSQAREILSNVHEFMKEGASQGVSIPIRNFGERAAAATGVPERTIRAIMNERQSIEMSGGPSTSFHTPGKEQQRPVTKSSVNA